MRCHDSVLMYALSAAAFCAFFQSTAAMAVLFGFLCLHFAIKPYKGTYLNNVEAFAIGMSTITQV